MVGDIPLMVSFGQQGLGSFSLQEVWSGDTFLNLLEYFGPEVWDVADSGSVTVQISNSRNGSFDKFNLKNTVGLAMKILKTDVLWVNFLKAIKSSNISVKNAFEIMKGASNSKLSLRSLRTP